MSRPTWSPRSTSTARCRRATTFVPFLRRVAGTPAAAGCVRHRRGPRGAAGATHWRRDDVKAESLAAAGRSAANAADLDETARDVRRRRASPATCAPKRSSRADWHRTQGHRLVIVSASLAVYLRPIAQHLRFDAVLATELEVGNDGG